MQEYTRRLPRLATSPMPAISAVSGAWEFIFSNASAAGWLVAFLPLLDLVVGQAQAKWLLQADPLSLSQAYHGAAMLVLAMVLISKLRWLAVSARGLLPAVVCLGASLLVTVVCILAEGDLTLETIVAVGQVIYWLILFLAVLSLASSKADRFLVLGGIVVAGLYASVCVIYIYFTAGQDASIYEKLIGNAAGFATAKGLTGVLATAGLVGLWMFRTRNRPLGAAILLVCIVGMLLTYQRAGLVGFVVAVVWLAWWGLRNRSRSETSWAMFGAALLVAAALALLALVGTGGLEQKWADMGDLEKAGSGRAAFWQVALTHYGQMDPLSKVSGIGYTRTAESLERRYGARIHTHSDFLDFLLMYGALGFVGYVAFHACVVRFVLRLNKSSSALAAGLAIYIVMLSQAFFTGQALAPSVMSCYLGAIACICATPDQQPVQRAGMETEGR